MPWKRKFFTYNFSKDELKKLIREAYPEIPEDTNLEIKEHPPGWSLDVSWEDKENYNE